MAHPWLEKPCCSSCCYSTLLSTPELAGYWCLMRSLWPAESLPQCCYQLLDLHQVGLQQRHPTEAWLLDRRLGPRLCSALSLGVLVSGRRYHHLFFNLRDCSSVHQNSATTCLILSNSMLISPCCVMFHPTSDTNVVIREKRGEENIYSPEQENNLRFTPNWVATCYISALHRE